MKKFLRNIILLFASGTVVVAVIQLVYHDSPYAAYKAREKLLHPFRYLHARYIDRRPKWGQSKSFAIRDGNAFVINLNTDTARMQHFQAMNNPVMNEIRRFPAHQWTTRTKIHNNNNNKNGKKDNDMKGNTGDTEEDEEHRMNVQKLWASKYPFLGHSMKHEKYGDAACSLSHILLWKEQLLDAPTSDNKDYIFVFEDDAQILEPLLLKRTIQAPDIADVIFLMESATKRVAVPWDRSSEGMIAVEDASSTVLLSTMMNANATRVLGGYGAWGYIITREGAQKMISYLEHSMTHVDLSFTAAPNVRVYLPDQDGQWPAVFHTLPGNDNSSRLGVNHGY